MDAKSEFTRLLTLVRNGDEDAAAELVKEYEFAIRVAIRTRLSDPAMRRQFDSMDICQSVLGSFFVRFSDGAFDLQEPRQLVGLLTAMARNKLAMRVRREFRLCRDARRTNASPDAVETLIALSPGPDQRAVDSDLVERIQGMLDEDTRLVAEHRHNGAEWNEIAEKLGGTAEARRKQYHRAMRQIAKRLEVDS